MTNSLMKQFKDCLEKNNCVRVETFYETLKETNNLVEWSKKFQNSDKFRKAMMETKPEDLEVLAEGFRCLSQIHINLIRDFDIFKIYPIRKYSSAFNYISKCNDFRGILKDIGYKEEEMVFELIVEKLKDIEKTTEVALDLQLSFMETMELYYLKFPGCKLIDLINKRDENIQKIVEDEKYNKMTPEDLKEIYKNCYFCGADVDYTGTCTVCSGLVTDYPMAWRHRKYLIETFGVEETKIAKPKEAEKKQDIPIDDPEPIQMQGNRGGHAEPPKGGQWPCQACTFHNDAAAINCSVCGEIRT